MKKTAALSPAQMAAALERPLLLIEETEQIVRMSDRTLRREEAAGRFPKRINISPKRIAHRTPEIKAWLEGAWIAPADGARAA